MLQKINDTIFALSTIAGRSGVAIIRISGGQALTCLRLLNPEVGSIQPRTASMLKLYSPESKELLDEAIVIYFKSPNSFTGEDVVELHLHGSLAVINDVIQVLTSVSFLRPAGPGEFSKRAFMNGKLDLTRAEGLADLINAETSMQRKIALRQLGGELENIYDQWRNEIITISAKVSALIDFPDDDLPQGIFDDLNCEIDTLINKIENHLANAGTGESIMKGIEIALIGAPNVGKSSLLNALAKREVAIVSEIAGTTRDVIEVRLNLNGYLVTLYDTAGLRETDDVIETQGIKRTQKQIESSDIIMAIVAYGNNNSHEVLKSSRLTKKDVIVVANKMDLQAAANDSAIPANYREVVSVSAKLNDGIDRLIEAMTAKISHKYAISAQPMITNARYRYYLQETLSYLNIAKRSNALEIIANDVNNASNSIGAITGKIEVDEILDKIFNSFCIGK